MENNNLKKILMVLAGIVVIAVAVVVIMKAMKNSENQPEPERSLEVSKTSLSADKFPSYLPQNLPLEKDAKILKNEDSTTNDGRKQSTRSYETKKTQADNLRIFTQYMKTNGWAISATVDNAEYKMVTGRKGNERLHVQMNTDPETKAYTVTIALTQVGQ